MSRQTSTIAAYALREALRRRVVLVVAALTAGFLVLYGFGVDLIHEEVAAEEAGPLGLRDRVVVGSTLLGLAMFVTFFLGSVLGAFLTLNLVRGDAEQGLLQPLVVRPVGRTRLLLTRFAVAAGVCAAYAVLVYATAVVLTGVIGDFWPGRPVAAGGALAAAVVVVVAVAVLGSTLLAGTANGIAVFMLIGAGLTAGLLGQIAGWSDSDTLADVATAVAWALPFEALYQHGLAALTADIDGLTRVVVELGILGGAQDGGPWVWLFAAGWTALVLGAAAALLARADL